MRIFGKRYLKSLQKFQRQKNEYAGTCFSSNLDFWYSLVDRYLIYYLAKFCFLKEKFEVLQFFLVVYCEIYYIYTIKTVLVYSSV